MTCPTLSGICLAISTTAQFTQVTLSPFHASTTTTRKKVITHECNFGYKTTKDRWQTQQEGLFFIFLWPQIRHLGLTAGQAPLAVIGTICSCQSTGWHSSISSFQSRHSSLVQNSASWQRKINLHWFAWLNSPELQLVLSTLFNKHPHLAHDVTRWLSTQSFHSPSSA